jgi:hypothetical protein
MFSFLAHDLLLNEFEKEMALRKIAAFNIKTCSILI